jgi:hypothetical protein
MSSGEVGKSSASGGGHILSISKCLYSNIEGALMLLYIPCLVQDTPLPVCFKIYVPIARLVCGAMDVIHDPNSDGRF